MANQENRKTEQEKTEGAEVFLILCFLCFLLFDFFLLDFFRLPVAIWLNAYLISDFEFPNRLPEAAFVQNVN
jgi:hypothetical protein